MSELDRSPGRGLVGDDRGRELAARLTAVRGRVDEATRAAGRSDAPTLIVVTKFHPAEDVVRLAALGVRDVGENRDQEARRKATEVDRLAGTPDPDGSAGSVRWHFIGQLQSNKAKYVVRYASAVHSVDRESLVDALSAAMGREQARRGEAGLQQRDPLDCLVQVDLARLAPWGLLVPLEPLDRPDLKVLPAPSLPTPPPRFRPTISTPARTPRWVFRFPRPISTA